MKRFLASALLIGASSFGLVGCDSTESEKKETVEVKTPEGTSSVEKTTEVKTDGKTPPAVDAPAPTPTPAPDATAPAPAPAPTPEAPK